ncbi:MAG: response regulator transcription factor [Pirellulales bacterium]|nr:response regulator transcription factor [Pirellulales bacterium]
MHNALEIRLLVADDQEMVRAGLRSMLGHRGIRIVAEASTGDDAIEAARSDEIDVALIDIRMPGGDGLYALQRIKEIKADLPCLMLSTYDNAIYADRSRALGAAGYIAKGTSGDKILNAVRLVAAGYSLWLDGER